MHNRLPTLQESPTIISATLEHVPGMLAVQQSCSLADKVAAGMTKADIERGGFLVHMMS
jgi:hypothetical protein